MKSLFLFSLIYTPITILRNLLYKHGFLKIKKINAPVISIGNITAGGTGKSPTVIEVGNIFTKANKKFCVLSRGYGRKSIIPFAINNSNGISADKLGDEPKMIGDRLKCHLGIGANRQRIGNLVIKKFGQMPFILDDGFSHRKIFRDLDILLLDANTPWGGGMLPYGTRRETLSNINRANAIIITGCEENNDIEYIYEKLEKMKFDGPIFTSQRIAECFVAPDGSEISLENFAKEKAYLFSGIANNERFFNLVESLNVNITGTIGYSDHFPFSQEEIDKIKENGNNSKILTTEKDFFRLGEMAKDIYYLRIKMQINNESEFENLILGLIS